MMAYAYGIDNDNSFSNRVKYSSLGNNIISSINNLVAIKAYKHNPENFLIKFLPKCCIRRTSGIDYIEHADDLPNWLEAITDTKKQSITIKTKNITEENTGDYSII